MQEYMTEYDILVNQVNDLIEEEKVSGITVRSLYQSVVEFEEMNPQLASVAVISPNSHKGGVSVKLTNAKISLKFALDTIFLIKPFFNEEGIWLILSVLKAVAFLMGSIVKRIDKNDAMVLFAIYRVQVGSVDRIINYLNTELEIELNENEIRKSLDTLLDLRTIELDAGNYRVKEEVIVKND